jgi:HD superfamily phosphohydrolase
MSSSTLIDALRQGFTEPVRDALWGHVYLTPELEALTRSIPFMRLHRIAQLGPAALCYPGATHTRAAHSIGVYHLTRRLLLNLIERGADSWLSTEGVRSMLCAALLHDIGHFPYAHSLKELPLVNHEELGAQLIVSEPLRSLIGKAGADAELTAAIIDTERQMTESGELRFYRALLSGSLDPDKLDYLNRDARYCGVPYGAQDVDFIISILYPHRERGVEIDSRGITSVESVLFSKYLMYRSVYWHHSVRAATAMIKKALSHGLSSGAINGDELYGLDDAGLFSLLSRGVCPLFSLGDAVRQGRLYKLILEEPFDEQKHNTLKDLAGRERREEELAAEFSCTAGLVLESRQIIVDVPERSAFETNLYVRDKKCFFGESSSFFKVDTITAFVKTLRIVRIYVEHPAAAQLLSLGIVEKIFGGK